MRTIFLALLLSSPLPAAEPNIHRDLPYVEPKNSAQSLDVYSPAEGKNHPIIFWIHGGGWREGDKHGVQKKPQAFTDKGFVFVSTNYRLAPQATIREMTGDLAKAIRWVHDHALEYRGDPERIVVMGHSAGAHLAALVSTDERYLKAEGLSLANVKGCVPLDTAVYDAPQQIASVPPARAAGYEKVFGDAKSQKKWSPITYVSKDKHIPPFLVLHVADRPDSTAQSREFAAALKEAGIPVTVVPAEGKTHNTLNSEFGLPDDKPTQATWKFLDEILKK